MRIVLVSVVLVVSACWSDRPPAQTTPPPAVPIYQASPGASSGTSGATSGGIRFAPSRRPSRCIRVIEHVFEQSKQDMASSGMSPAMLEEMQQVAVASCQEHEWTEEILDCYEDIATSDQTTACYRRMSQEQQDDFMKRLTDVMQRHNSGAQTTP